MMLDFIALLLQAAGGATVGGDNLSPDDFDRSLAILQAGLSIHLAGIVIFVLVSSDFALLVYRARPHWNQSFAPLQASRKFRIFLYSETNSPV
jgi:hypothetical protein